MFQCLCGNTYCSHVCGNTWMVFPASKFRIAPANICVDTQIIMALPSDEYTSSEYVAKTLKIWEVNALNAGRSTLSLLRFVKDINRPRVVLKIWLWRRCANGDYVYSHKKLFSGKTIAAKFLAME